jgi:phycocyanin-associated rod linker protein
LDDTQPIELRPKHTPAEAKTVIDAVYRQRSRQWIFVDGRSAHGGGIIALTNGQLSVRGICTSIGEVRICTKLSSSYPHFHTRVIELNFKHLLRDPPPPPIFVPNCNPRPTSTDSHLNSAEYDASFGDFTVPLLPRFRGLRRDKTVGFPRMFAQLYRGYATSDKSHFEGATSLSGRLSTRRVKKRAQS